MTYPIHSLTITVLMTCFVTLNTAAQSWQKTYDYYNINNYGADVVSLPNNEYVAIGNSNSNTPAPVILTRAGLYQKVDSVGNIIWQKAIHLQGVTRLRSATAINNSYYFAGYRDTMMSNPTYPNGKPFSYPILIKTDAAGDTTWVKEYTFLGNEDSDFTSMQTTNDGNLIITGKTGNSATYQSDVLLAKIDTNGHLLWVKKHNTTLPNPPVFGPSSGNDIRTTSDGGFIIGGYAGNQYNSYVLRLNALGDTLWTKIIPWDNPNGGNTHAIEIANDGGYLLVGHSENPDNQYKILKLAANGALDWEKKGSVDTFYSYVYAVGNAYFATGSQNGNLMISKLNSNGNELWSQTFGSNASGKKIKKTFDDKLIVVGSIFDSLSNNYDIYLVKMDTNIVLNSIVIEQQQLQSVLWTYPNPATLYTEVHVVLPTHFNKAQLQIYAMDGRLIQSYPLAPSSQKQSIKISTQKMPKGIYTYCLNVDNQIINSKKVVLVD